MALTFGGATSDRVALTFGSSISDLQAFTILAWHFPTTQTGGRRWWAYQGASSLCDAIWTFADTNDVEFTVPRAGGDAVAVTNTLNLSTNTWYCTAFTFDGTDGPRVFNGSLTAALAEAGYASRTASSGAILARDVSMTIGNISGATVAYQGRIAVYMVFNTRKTLAELQRIQFRPFKTEDCVAYHILGFNGTGTQPDYSGNGNNGTVTGATVGNHVPLPPPFGNELDDYLAVLGVINGSANITLGAVTLSAAGTLPIVGTATPTLAAVTLSGTGALPIVGAATPTLDAVTLSAAGTLPIVGSAAITLGDVTTSAAGALALVGTSSVTLGDVTLSAAGSSGNTGSLTSTLGDITLSAAGALALAGSASITLGNVTLSASETSAVITTGTVITRDTAYHSVDVRDTLFHNVAVRDTAVHEVSVQNKDAA